MALLTIEPNHGSAHGAKDATMDIYAHRRPTEHRIGGVLDANAHAVWPPRLADNVAMTGTAATASN